MTDLWPYIVCILSVAAGVAVLRWADIDSVASKDDI